MNDFAALPPAADFNVAPSMGAPAQQPQENPFEIFHRVHRLLRGRYIYAIAFGAVGAIAGALVGFKATVPKYQSVGMIRIKARNTLVYQLRTCSRATGTSAPSPSSSRSPASSTAPCSPTTGSAPGAA